MQCPACRNKYDEAKFRTVAATPPPAPAPAPAANASAVHTRGWESVSASAAAKKGAPSRTPSTGRTSPPVGRTSPDAKKAVLPTPVVVQDPRVEAILLQLFEFGVLLAGDLDYNVQLALKHMDVGDAESVLAEFLKKDMGKVRNKSAFLHGIITRYAQEDELLAAGSDAFPSRHSEAGPSRNATPVKQQQHSLQGRVSRVLTMADAAGLRC
jgi:hypothetical protein